MQCWTGFAIAGLALWLGAGSAAAIDLDDPRAEPLYFAVETLSAEAVIVSGRGAGGVTHYRLEGSPENAALTTTSRLALAESETWYVRADLDGMVFGATPEFTTGGEGSGSGFASMEADVLQGGAGESYVIYRLPQGRGYARGLAFGLSIRDTLAVPAGEGAYRGTLALYNDGSEAMARDGALSYSAFGGEATVVVITSGIEIGIETGVAVADIEKDFLGFTSESASGGSRHLDNPSAPAVLGSIGVGARGPDPAGRRAPVYAARGGRPVTAEDVIESVSVRIEGDMTFGMLDLRTGTETDRCLATGPATRTSPGGGVVALSPPVCEVVVENLGIATLAHREDAWGRRNLCVWLPERKATGTPVRIPIMFYQATVSVTPPGGGEEVVRSGLVGEVRRSGARVEIVHLTASDRYDRRIVIVNRGGASVRYEFVAFAPAAGVTVVLTPEAAAQRESGLNTVAPGSLVVLPVAETLRITGTAGAGDGLPVTSATLSFNASECDIDVATVQFNRGDGSTDTVVYAVRAAVEPEDQR